MRFHLAPPALTRNIAILSMLYKVSRGSATPPIRRLFCLTPSNLVSTGFIRKRRHRWQIHNPVEVGHQLLIKRSAFGMIKVSNDLLHVVVQSVGVTSFQRALLNITKAAVTNGRLDLRSIFNAS